MDVGTAVVGVRPQNVWVDLEDMEEVGTERMWQRQVGDAGRIFRGGKTAPHG